MSWERLKPSSGPQVADLPAKYGTLYLLPTPRVGTHPESYWLVGEYKFLQPLAEELRQSQTLRDKVAACKVRLGLRESDLPPTSPDQQKSYGANVKSDKAGKDHTDKRHPSDQKTVSQLNALVAEQMGKSEGRLNPGSGNTQRTTDEWKNRDSYWFKKTPEAHHIVEFTQLEALGVSKGKGKGKEDMDYDQLPCVLLAAEFHQRFITRILEQTRVKALADAAAKRAYLKTMREVYSTLYTRNGTLFLPLWDASQEILDQAALKLKA